MKVIVPQFVGGDGFGDDTMAEQLTSNIAEYTAGTWVTGTTYSADEIVKYQLTQGSEKGIYKEFKSLQAANTGNNPYTATTYWSDQGATNRWKMFDYLIMSESEAEAVDGTIAVDLHCRRISAIGFINVMASGITIKVYKGDESADKIPANLIQTVTIDLSQLLDNWFDYFFEDFKYTRDVSVPVDIYTYYDVVLEITFTPPGSLDCTVGQVLPGRSYSLGNLLYGINTGIKDFSRILENDFGFTYLSQGNFKKRLDGNLIVGNENINTVGTILTQLRAVPTVWEGNSGDNTYNDLLLYGFCRKFTFVHDHPNHTEINIEIEGMI